MADARVLHLLRQQLTPQQWRLLLKAGLCIGCELALKEVTREAQEDEEDLAELADNSEDDGFEEDYGRAFPEE